MVKGISARDKSNIRSRKFRFMNTSFGPSNHGVRRLCRRRSRSNRRRRRGRDMRIRVRSRGRLRDRGGRSRR